MNVERLLSVLNLLLETTQRTGLEAKVTEIVGAIQSVVNEPGNAAHPEQLAQKLAALADVAATDTLDQYPVLSREIIEEFGLEALIASDTESKVRAIVQSNAATPGVALKAVTDLRDEIAGDTKALRQIREGLKRFNLHSDEIEPDKAGISFIIPRGDESVPAPRLISDLKDFEFVENAFERLATGHQTGARVRALASSDFAITLDSPLSVGVAIAFAIKFVIARYQEILNLRRSQIELRKLKSESAAQAVENDIAERIAKISDDVADKLMQKFNRTAEEERAATRKAVLKIAYMIDRRYRIEVRVSTAGKGKKEGAESTDEQALASARSEILELQSTTKFFEAEKEPLLLLTVDDDLEQ